MNKVKSESTKDSTSLVVRLFPAVVNVILLEESSHVTLLLVIVTALLSATLERVESSTHTNPFVIGS